MGAFRMTVRDRLDLAGGAVNEGRTGFARFADAACAWVIDGATGLADREYVPHAPTDAAWLAERLSSCLAATDPARLEVAGYFADILTGIAAEYDGLVPDAAALPPYALPSAAAVWAATDKNRIAVAWLGDCRAIVAQGHDVTVIGAADESPWEDGINDVVRDRLTCAPGPVGSLLDALALELRQRRSRLTNQMVTGCSVSIHAPLRTWSST
jgi:hypothetical protein